MPALAGRYGYTPDEVRAMRVLDAAVLINTMNEEAERAQQ